MPARLFEPRIGLIAGPHGRQDHPLSDMVGVVLLLGETWNYRVYRVASDLYSMILSPEHPCPWCLCQLAPSSSSFDVVPHLHMSWLSTSGAKELGPLVLVLQGLKTISGHSEL